MSKTLLEFRGITKTFPGVKALSDVNFSVKEGTIHSIVGENGAGKSTLMNIVSGIYAYGTYEGDILVNGEVCEFKDLKDSEEKGIAIIHQELALIPYLSIMENVFLGNEQSSGAVINWEKTYSKAVEQLDKVGLKDSPNTLVKNIGVGKQQLVEVIKALSKDVKILILDEPTASLNEDDSENLLNLLLELKGQGITCILISHKLNEVSFVSDTITVIRDGAVIKTLDNKNKKVEEDEIIQAMVGRKLVDRYPKRTASIGDIYAEIKDWNVYDPDSPEKQIIKNVNFHVRKGEILGISGLMGSGRTELMMSIFGKAYGRNISGTFIKDGKEIQLENIRDAIDNGIAYVTEDRKDAGLILMENVMKNISLASLEKISNKSVVDENKEVMIANEYKEKMNIRTPNILQITGNLSGGNQQKVVLSKWILSEPDILILDEPTRGIDVGAKYEIYTIINELAEAGKSVVIISSELPEILGICDRIYVMNEGKFVGELDRKDASQETIMRCIMKNEAI